MTEPALGLFELGHTRHPSTVLHPNGSSMCTTDPLLSAVFVRLVLCQRPVHKACRCVRPTDHDGPCNCAYRDGAP